MNSEEEEVGLDTVSVLHKLREQHELLTDRFIELEKAYTELLQVRRTSVVVPALKIPTTGGESTPKRLLSARNLPTARTARRMNDSQVSAHSAVLQKSVLSKLEAELEAERTKRKQADCEILRLRSLLDRTRASTPRARASPVVKQMTRLVNSTRTSPEKENENRILAPKNTGLVSN